MNAYEILSAAQDLIRDPKNWTKDAFGIDESGGELCSTELDKAVCYCSMGALMKASPNSIETGQASYFLRREMDDCIVSFNDDHKHDEIIAAFERAKESAKASRS